jgi:hypothetical protein
MPHKASLLTWLASAWGQLGTTAQSIIILVAALAGRTIYRGGRVREFVGEALLLVVLLHVLTPHLALIFPRLTGEGFAAILGLGGLHLLRSAVKKRTGIDLGNKTENQNNNG